MQLIYKEITPTGIETIIMTSDVPTVHFNYNGKTFSIIPSWSTRSLIKHKYKTIKKPNNATI